MPDWYWKRQNKGRLAGRCIVRLSVSFFHRCFYGAESFARYHDLITLHRVAKEAFSKLPEGKIPKVKDLNDEFTRLLSEKRQLTMSTKK